MSKGIIVYDAFSSKSGVLIKHASAEFLVGKDGCAVRYRETLATLMLEAVPGIVYCTTAAM